MNTLFISDLHLSPDNEALTLLFVKLLTEQVPHADALYILGDLFDYWIGDDNQNAFNQHIVALLAKAARKTPIYLLSGNRDFLLGERFAKQSQCQMLEDFHCIECYGKRIVLLHGDALCLADKRHQFFRRLTQRRWIRKCFLYLPLRWRLRIADNIRAQSQQRQITDNPIFDITQSEIPPLLKTHNADMIIHGHTHKPSIHLLKDGAENFKQHIVLSDWGTQGNVLTITSDGDITLTYF